ncbi:BTB and MATH domain-containing protein 36-like [Babylonia areolata]|uniref:BTB and MATH domain-containing protein 36-like n=1 Tax=Babylonia areolata TaxID=304850 RepID=UPI003FD5FB34
MLTAMTLYFPCGTSQQGHPVRAEQTMALNETVTVTDFFQYNDSLCDVTIIVGNMLIHFNKALLMVSSPVFARMFTSDFKEKKQKTIELPGKDPVAVLSFLRQLHPAHSWEELSSDAELEALLKLADEYDVPHIKTKCSKFIRNQMEFTLTTHRVLQFLYMCHVHQLTELQDELLILASEHPVEQLKSSEFFSRLEPSKQLLLVMKRCQLLEDEKVESRKVLAETGQMIRKLKSIVHRLPGMAETLPETCGGLCYVHCQCSRQGWAVTTGTERWCERCATNVSSLQRSFCQGCVMKKSVVIVNRLHGLIASLKNVECFRCNQLSSLSSRIVL